jgi:cytochrome c
LILGEADFSCLGSQSPSRTIESVTEIRFMPRNQPAADWLQTFHLPLYRSMIALSLGALSLAAAAILWQPRIVAAQTQPAPDSVAFYTQRVQPIFENHCYGCHGGTNHRGHFSLATRAGLLKGGMDGSVVVPGNASQSLLLKLIRHEGPADDPMPMPPPPRHKLSDADIATITQWIQAGMAMPPDPPTH